MPYICLLCARADTFLSHLLLLGWKCQVGPLVHPPRAGSGLDRLQRRPIIHAGSRLQNCSRGLEKYALRTLDLTLLRTRASGSIDEREWFRYCCSRRICPQVTIVAQPWYEWRWGKKQMVNSQQSRGEVWCQESSEWRSSGFGRIKSSRHCANPLNLINKYIYLRCTYIRSCVHCSALQMGLALETRRLM